MDMNTAVSHSPSDISPFEISTSAGALGTSNLFLFRRVCVQPACCLFEQLRVQRGDASAIHIFPVGDLRPLSKSGLEPRLPRDIQLQCNRKYETHGVELLYFLNSIMWIVTIGVKIHTADCLHRQQCVPCSTQQHDLLQLFTITSLSYAY
jgi:hypothetical protein